MNRLASLLIGCTILLVLPLVGHAQSKVYRSVSDGTVEKILQSLEVKYAKEERKHKDATIMFFDFKRGDHSFRLYNYQSDLWIECTYERAMKAEEINRWNADAKFSRLVMIEQKDKTILSLESQLDCLGGVTDALIRQYINRFEEEAKRFAKFSAK
jgi:hypothetical protein